jgi:hypothetical protein
MSMADFFSAMFENTFFLLRVTFVSKGKGLIGVVGSAFYATVNTALRLAAFYVGIRVVMTAVAHGSFW